MYVDTRRRPIGSAAGIGIALAALAAALVPAGPAGAARAGQGPPAACEAGNSAYRAAGPKVTAKLPATLRRGAKPTKIRMRVTNRSGHTHKRVLASVAIFGSGGGTYLSAKDVRVDQYIRHRGWHRVKLETGCDPSLSRTLWPAKGFTLRPGATFRTTVRVAITRHANPKIKHADLDLGAGRGSWTGDRHRWIHLTG